MIRVLIVDDQVVVCEGLRVVLNASANIDVVGIANNGQQAIDAIPAAKPDLVLMDLKMPIMNGIQATEIIAEKHPDLSVLILTTYDEDEWVYDAIRAGAAGYLLKDADSTDIIAAIEGTVAGKTHIDPAVAQRLFKFVKQGAPTNQEIIDLLTERELRVLQLLAHGLTNAAIAERLFLAEGTVRNHVSNILSKLDVTDRAQATAIAWKNGLVSTKLDE